jgi:hypothetical protein
MLILRTTRNRTQSNFTESSLENSKPKRGIRSDGIIYYNPDSDIDLDWPVENYEKKKIFLINSGDTLGSVVLPTAFYHHIFPKVGHRIS